MSKGKKFIAVLMGALLAFSVASTLVGCRKREEYDDTKTQLFISTYNGGYKTEWLDKVAARFEAQYADYKIDDKVGVQIIIDATTDFGNSLLQNWGSVASEIFFTEGVYYYDFVNGGYILDLTDAITSDLPGENKSIFDKFSEQQKEFYAARKDDGKDHFYGVPFASGFSGLVYDIDMFYTEGLYYTKDSDDNALLPRDARFIRKSQKDANGAYYTTIEQDGQTYRKTTAGDILSHGPDGEYGTDDDGLPDTYDAFFDLCDYMVYDCSGLVPFAWSGKSKAGYLAWLWNELAIDCNGAEESRKGFNFEGSATNVVSVGDDGTVTKLPDANLAEEPLAVFRTEGKYRAYEFMNKIVDTPAYYEASDGGSETSTNYDAQRTYLNSKTTATRYAFLVDGIWWQNEAKDAFDYMAKIDASNSKQNRQFGLLPLPKVDDTRLGAPTILDTHLTLGFVSSKIAAKKADLAKEFIRFCFTEESNKEFTLTTGVPRPLEYTLTESEVTQLSPFERNIYNVFRSADIVYPISKSKYYLDNVGRLVNSSYYTRLNGTNYISFWEIIKEVNATPKQMFDGIYTYASSTFLK